MPAHLARQCNNQRFVKSDNQFLTAFRGLLFSEAHYHTWEGLFTFFSGRGCWEGLFTFFSGRGCWEGLFTFFSGRGCHANRLERLENNHKVRSRPAPNGLKKNCVNQFCDRTRFTMATFFFCYTLQTNSPVCRH